MGLFSDITEGLFGDSGKQASKDQQKANKRAQEFIEQQARRARTDIMGIYPELLNTLLGGQQGAWEAMQAFYPQQIDVMRRGNMKAQGTLLGGLPAMQSAILGAPIDYSGLKVVNPAPGVANTIGGLQGPQGVDINALLQGMSGFNLNPGQTTNQEVVQQAYNAGILSDQDLADFQKMFKGAGNAGGTRWASAAPETLLRTVGTKSPLNSDWRARMTKLFTALPRTQ